MRGKFEQCRGREEHAGNEKQYAEDDDKKI